MFTFIRSLFSHDLLFELSENKLSIKAFSSNMFFEEEPYIAIEKTKKGEVVKAIGTEAKTFSAPNVRVLNPFKHNRSFVADFMCAEKILQHGMYTIHKSKIKPSPRVIVHQLEKTEGGLTDIEESVLRELAIGAGAREVVIYLGSKINTNVESFDTVKSRVSAT
ncbi:rod shape-determining protein [Shewanella fidelis]|uniref:Rod shape-determining protein n=1 Tax=Shewanella fidelis TaxID=173509 RepID=A0AAW8NM42_9GAMM|nr:rod shape-determining protein [Shewanella fidelis]MDR8523942.1 rod shape-determining protein [Shewanella fidelis]MDW4810489.1 rod shape-determining protein [Shewanella fidelis]MDW4814610.1 rod shape-determining protein [Shewanella fidelis]MDW4818700.1 rod shape-determining protein [Shewanella fidelis]MDW4823623.1 rod shape-determining protein [Shewanella fidelis]